MSKSYLDAQFEAMDRLMDQVGGEYPSVDEPWDGVKQIIDNLRHVLLSNGFVPCDSEACNCGSWHHRYGLAERFREIQDVLRDAGVLDSATGSRPIDGVRKLIERHERSQALLRELVDLEGPQPGPLDWFDKVIAHLYGKARTGGGK